MTTGSTIHCLFRLTPDRLIVHLLIAECLLWRSNWPDWPAWHKGYAVLACVAMEPTPLAKRPISG